MYKSFLFFYDLDLNLWASSLCTQGILYIRLPFYGQYNSDMLLFLNKPQEEKIINN